MFQKQKLAKSVIVAGSLFWMVMGIWGINTSFEIAKETRNYYIQELRYSRGVDIEVANFRKPSFEAQPAKWATPPEQENQLKVDMERAGIPDSPYVFEPQTIKALLVSLLCVVVSFFVLYSVFLIGPRRHVPIPESKTWSSYDIPRE